MIAKEMKWNSEVVGDAAEHVLFSNKKPPNWVWVVKDEL
jgi:hypothetical protein